MNDERIDIILLTCNRIKLLKQVITSFEERLKTDYHLIIVDNNSEDGTVEYLKKLKEDSHYPITLILNGPGEEALLSDANNIGMKYVKSEFFITTQDDYLVPDTDPCVIKQLIAIMNRNPEYAAISLRTPQMKRKVQDYEVTETGRTCIACFRIQRKSEIEKMEGFGHVRHWEGAEMTRRCRDILGKKTGIATNLWANNIGVEKAKTYPDWYKEKVNRNFEFIKNRPIGKSVKIDPKTNKPI